MATLGTITLALEAGTADFRKEIEKSGESITLLGRAAEGAHGILEHFVEGLGISSGMEAFETAKELIKKGIEQIKEAYEQVNEIGHNALKLGISAEQMSRFQHAANATHTDIQALTTGMDHLNRQIGLVAVGDKSAAQAAKAFQQLGVDVNSISATSPDEAFKRIATALNGVHSTFERAAIAQEIFGRGGRELIPVMQDLSGLMRESDNIGFTRTAENIEAAEREERELARITDSLKGMFMNLATSGWAEALVDKFKWVSQAASAVFDQSNRRSQITSDLRSLVELKNAITQTQAAVAKPEGFDQRYGEAQELVKSLREQYEAEKRLFTNLPAVHSGYTIDPKVIARMHEQLESQEKILAGLEKEKQARDAAAEASAKDLKDFRKNVEEIGKTLDAAKLSASVAGLTESQKKVAEFAAKIKAANLVSYGSWIPEYKAALDEIDRKNALANNIKRARDEMQHLHEQATELGKTTSQINLDRILHSDVSFIEKIQARLDSLRTSTFEKHKKDLEEAHRLLEQLATPAQKYQQELARINELERKHDLTAKQAADLRDAAAAKQHGGRTEFAGALVRRFDFRMPDNPKDLQKPEQKAAEKTADLLDQMLPWVNSIYQKVFNGWGPDTEPTTADF